MISFELFKELMNRTINNRHYINYFSHDLILNKNISFSFDDLNIQVIVLLWVINYWIFWMKFMTNLGNRVFNPNIVWIHHWFNAFNVRLDKVVVFSIELTKTWFYWLNLNFVLSVLWILWHYTLFQQLSCVKRLV